MLMQKPSVDSEKLHPRLKNESKTIEAMISLYCRAHHGSGSTNCGDCARLVTYARQRLRSCPFQHNKPTCGNCTVHCYKTDMRETIRKIMRYAGPRMLLHHPIMAVRHLLDSRRKAQVLPRKRKPCDVTSPQSDPTGRATT